MDEQHKKGTTCHLGRQIALLRQQRRNHRNREKGHATSIPDTIRFQAHMLHVNPKDRQAMAALLLALFDAMDVGHCSFDSLIEEAGKRMKEG